MSRNRFEVFSDRLKKVRQSEASKIQERKKYLSSISENSKGTPPKELLGSRGASTAEEFISFMKKHSFAGASKLKLEKPKSGRPLSETDMRVGSFRYGRMRHIIKKSRWYTLWRGKGYLIGVLSFKNRLIFGEKDSLKVYLCDDGKLRCDRNLSIFFPGETYATGFGSLPCKFSLMGKGAISTGEFVSDLDNSTDRIFKQIPLGTLLNRYVEKTV